MSRYAILIVLLAVSFPAHAPYLHAQRVLTLEEAQRHARENAEELAIARLDVEHAERGVVIARSQRFPRVDLTASYTHVSETGGIDLAIPGLISRSIRFGDGNLYESAITASVPLFTGFRLQAAQRMQETQAAIADVQLKGSETSLHNRIAAAYRQAQLALRTKAIYDQQLQYLGAQLVLLKKLHAQGQILAYDTLLLSTRMSALRVERATAIANYGNARLTVADLVNISPDFDVVTDMDMRTGIPVENEEALMQEALSRRSDLAILQELRNLGDERVRAEKAAYLPAISAFASYRYGKPGVDQVTNEWMDYYTAGVALQWNLWSWGADRSRVDQQEIQRRETDLRTTRLERQVRASIRGLRNDLAVLAETRTMLDEQIGQERVKRELLQARVSQGVATATELLDAETSLTTALIRREQSDIQYLLKLTELANVIGKDI